MKLKVFHKNVMKVIKIKREDLKIYKKKKKRIGKNCAFSERVAKAHPYYIV
jgi:hypothetical protein